MENFFDVWRKPPTYLPTDRSKVVPLLQLFFVCALAVWYVAFVVSLFVSHITKTRLFNYMENFITKN